MEAVLLAAHGAPERLDDLPEYLGKVRGGRPVSPAVLAEVTERYRRIGGGSPLGRWTRAQATALEERLGLPVFVGMRNWQPSIAEALSHMATAGVRRAAAVCLVPQNSALTVGLYRRAAEAAAPAFELRWAPGLHASALLAEAFAERLAPLAAGRTVVFTAHSLPAAALPPGDPYEAECRATAAAVARRLALPAWEFAFQSQGLSQGTHGVEWLGPTVESVIDRMPGEVVIAPIGFVCDHVEILYDIDVHFREYGAARGVRVLRPESLNDSPTFTAALAEAAQACLG